MSDRWTEANAQNLLLRKQSTEQKKLHVHSFSISAIYWPKGPSVQSQADEVKFQYILHILHPNSIRIPLDQTLEKTPFCFSTDPLPPITVDLIKRHREKG